MTSRESVLKAVMFKKPDRPPISHALLPSSQYHYGKALESIVNNIHEDFGWSLLPDLPREKLSPLYKLGKNKDDWGTLWMVTEEGRCGIPIIYPIKSDWSKYKDYKWPEVFAAGMPKYRLYSGHINGKSSEYYARGGWITLFEQMQQMIGFEDLLISLISDLPEVYKLKNDLLLLNLAWIDKWLNMEYQGLHFADD